jgi:MFS family permease
MALSYEILKHANFRRLMATRLCGIFAMQAQAVIVGWQVYTLTKDPLMLGLVGLTEALPAILFALFAGHIVDKSRPHRVFLNCLRLHSVLSLAMLAIAGGLIETNESITLATLFVGVFLSGILRSFIMPASSTLLARIVPRHHIPAASAWLSSGFQLAAIGGPAITGLIYGGYGVQVAWFIPFCFMVGAVVAISGISEEYRRFKNHDSREPALKSIASGWRFVRSSNVLLPIMALDMFAVLFGGAVAMLPMFADQILHTGSEGLGLLRAAPAVGSIITALYFALNPMRAIRGRRLILTITGFGICMIGFGLSTSFFYAALFLALSGAFDSVSMVIRSTLMQLLVPDHVRGRVSSLNSMFIISSNEIGAFESGLAASLLGLVPSLIFGGSMTLLVVGSTALFCPALRKLVVDTTKHS